jgi:hypothetical protein
MSKEKKNVVIVEDGDENSNFKIIKSVVFFQGSYEVLPKDQEQQKFRTAIPTFFTNTDAVTNEEEIISNVVNQCNAFFVLDYQLTPSNDEKDKALSNAEMFYQKFIANQETLNKLPVLFYSSQAINNERYLTALRKELHDKNVKTEFVSINYEMERDKVCAICNAIKKLLAIDSYKLSVRGAIKGTGIYAQGTEIEIIFDNDGKKEFVKWEIINGNGYFKENGEYEETATFITGDTNTEIEAKYNDDTSRLETPPSRNQNGN